MIIKGSDQEIQYVLKRYGIQLDTFPIDLFGQIRHEILNDWFRHDLIKGDKSSHNKGLEAVSTISRTSDFLSVQNWDKEQQTRTPSPSDVAVFSKDSVNGRICKPCTNDYLLGRGKGKQDHPGNILFRQTCAELKEDYDNAGKMQKRKLASEIAETLKLAEGRFLKRASPNGPWIEADSAEEIKTVMQLFRTLRKRN